MKRRDEIVSTAINGRTVQIVRNCDTLSIDVDPLYGLPLFVTVLDAPRNRALLDTDRGVTMVLVLPECGHGRDLTLQ